MLETPTDPFAPATSADLHQEMLEALVAGDGLAAVTAIASERAGARVEILIPRPGSDGTTGTETERHVADLVAGRRGPRPAEVRDLVPIVCGGQMEGAVVLHGEGIPGFRAVLETASVVGLTALALLNARADATEESAPTLVRDLLTGKWIPPGEVVRRARLLGCDLSGRFVGVALEPLDVQPGRIVAIAATMRPDALVETHGDRVYALLPGDTNAIREFGAALSGRAPYAASSAYAAAKDAAIALREADLLLAMARHTDQTDTDRKAWAIPRLRFGSLITAPGQLGRFVEEAIGPALRHDKARDAELERTFWAFRDANWNLSRTAQLMFAHRHTVRNRLDRIAELTNLNPDDSHDRDLLSLAFTANAVVSHYEERRTFLEQLGATKRHSAGEPEGTGR